MMKRAAMCGGGGATQGATALKMRREFETEAYVAPQVQELYIPEDQRLSLLQLNEAHLQMADRRSADARLLLLRPALGRGQALLRVPLAPGLPPARQEEALSASSAAMKGASVAPFSFASDREPRHVGCIAVATLPVRTASSRHRRTVSPELSRSMRCARSRDLPRSRRPQRLAAVGGQSDAMSDAWR